MKIVALLVSAWIEIFGLGVALVMYPLVALLVSAWIEIQLRRRLDQARSVALLVSAWIEIRPKTNGYFLIFVALLVSAWIEISPTRPNNPEPTKSHSS